MTAAFSNREVLDEVSVNIFIIFTYINKNNYMRSFSVIFLFLFILVSCTNKNETNNQKPHINAPENNIHQEDLDGIFITPADSMNIEQKELRKKVTTLMREKIKLENGRLINKATKKDFEKQGIPTTYYYLLQESIDELNAAIEKGGVDVQRLYEEMLEGIHEN